MKCPNCGRHIKAGSRFCLHCGFPLNKVSVKYTKKPYRKFIYWVVGLVVVIALIAGGLWCKQYFTPARSFSRQLPKSTWIESNMSKGHKISKKGKHGKKKIIKKPKKSKMHYSYIVSSGSELLSFNKNKKTTKIFNILSQSSKIGNKLRSNVSKNMNNVLIKNHYTYHIKGNSLYFNDGTSFRNIKKSKNGYTFKCYKNKKFLHKETVKKYKTLSEPIK